MNVLAQLIDSSSDLDAYNLALFGFRVMLAVIMLAHGWNHIWGGGKIEGTAGWFASMGMKPGIVHAWLASVTELAAGGLLLVGLLTPFACAGVVGVMAVAFVINHAKNGFFIFRPGEGYEYVLSLCVFALVLAVLGAGEWSLDNAFDIVDDLNGWTGLVIAAVLGGGGAAALVLFAWKPEPATSDA